MQSLQHQLLLAEREQALLAQNTVDAIASFADQRLDDQANEFSETVDKLLTTTEVSQLAPQFDQTLRQAWPNASVGFAVNLPTLSCASPVAGSSPDASRFLQGNLSFLCSTTNAPIYSKASYLPPKTAPTPTWAPEPVTGSIPRQADFPSIVAGKSQSILSRFLQDELSVMIWHKPDNHPEQVFGAELAKSKVQELLSDNAFEAAIAQARTASLGNHPDLNQQLEIAILNDKGFPVYPKNTKKEDYANAFVSTDISDTLPHWEVTAHIKDAGALQAAAQEATWTLGAIIAFLTLAITTGSVFILRQVHRQMLIARQKTDFVSNVSHELKTPLTSIRMFSELLANEKETDRKKRSQFLSIIQDETARLTRLINNVLDFTRLERKERPFELTETDLRSVVEKTCSDFAPSMERAGFKFLWTNPDSPVPVSADKDALSQVLLNLLSNALKYSRDDKDVKVTLCTEDNHAHVSVSDQGDGIPDEDNERIFEKFHRLHDRLDTNRSGTGLGLTLARQIAQAHGGRLYRQLGQKKGSTFTLELPLSA